MGGLIFALSGLFHFFSVLHSVIPKKESVCLVEWCVALFSCEILPAGGISSGRRHRTRTRVTITNSGSVGCRQSRGFQTQTCAVVVAINCPTDAVGDASIVSIPPFRRKPPSQVVVSSISPHFHHPCPHRTQFDVAFVGCQNTETATKSL